MHPSVRHTFVRRSCCIAAALFVATLAACGGDDGGLVIGGPLPELPGRPGPADPPPAQAACRPQGNVTYSGSAAQVAPRNGTLAVVVMPSLPRDYQRGRDFTAPEAPAASQVQQPGGAFTTLASSAAAGDCLGIEHGMVTEIQGIGSDVAIGRWIRAKDTDGNTYTEVQGVHYAVGTPLALPARAGTLACTQRLADTVSVGNGGNSGTLLDTTSATLDLGTRTLNDLVLTVRMSDGEHTLTQARAPLNGVATGGALAVQTVVVGHDASEPMVALGYSATLPNGNEAGGVAVLSCR
ncbi:MAG: hypothetical protein GAK40_01282 [Burkholderia plantarii]|nr:MAG: hypothetical protein GAK40_01282 [Burkholderia plantarii]